MKRLFTLLSCLFLTNLVLASQCDNFFPNNKEIILPNTKTLCNSFYVSLYDETKKAVLLSSERVQKHTVTIPRTNDFHSDSRIKQSPVTTDYLDSNYDRGHLTPAEEAATTAQMHDTFLLTNIAPQSHVLNTVKWRMLEEAIHKQNAVTILTGVLYPVNPITISKRHIPVPSHFYKVVYYKDKLPEAYIAENKDEATINKIALDALEKQGKITLH